MRSLAQIHMLLDLSPAHINDLCFLLAVVCRNLESEIVSVS